MLLAIVIPSPLGPLRLVADDDALCGVYFPGHRGTIDGNGSQAHRDVADCADTPPPGVLASAAGQLREYFAGTRRVFDVPLRAAGTEFQQRVWLRLREIPFAVTRSYGELAASIGNRNASRAVGAANGKNPISIIVPCHRVIGADGSLTGFGGGEPAKRWLLDHEARIAGTRLL
jgi:methylated-DNA-[protein]-cysteine S-methyltransferase